MLSRKKHIGMKMSYISKGQRSWRCWTWAFSWCWWQRAHWGCWGSRCPHWKLCWSPHPCCKPQSTWRNRMFCFKFCMNRYLCIYILVSLHLSSRWILFFYCFLHVSLALYASLSRSPIPLPLYLSVKNIDLKTKRTGPKYTMVYSSPKSYMVLNK